MEYGLKVSWISGTKYYDTTGAVIGGKKYESRILGLNNFSRRLTEIKDSFNTPQLDIILNDKDGNIRAYFADEITSQRNIGINGELVDPDGVSLMKLRLTDIDFSEDEATIKFSQKIDILENNLLNIITDQEYPDAVSDAYGEHPIPYLYGKVAEGGNDGSYSAWKVDLDIGGGVTLHYLLADHTITSVDRVQENEVNIAAGWTLRNHTDGRAYLIYAGGTADTIEVNVTRTIANLTTLVTNLFSDLFGSYAYVPAAAFITRLDVVLYIPTMNHLSIIFTEQLTGSDFMDFFAQAFCCDWFVDSDGLINISYIDMESSVGSEAGSFTKNDISSDFNIKLYLNEIKNKVSYKFKYRSIGNAYKWNFVYHKKESQDNAGIFDDDIDFRLSAYDAVAFGAVKYYTNMHQYPEYRVNNVCFTGKFNLDKFLGYNVGDIIKITHPDALSITVRYYRILEMKFDLDSENTYIDLRDINFLESIESHVLLIQPGYSGVNSASPYFYDFAALPTHGVVGTGGMVHATDQYRFGAASGFLEDIQAWVIGSKTPSLFKLQGDAYDFVKGCWFWITDATPAAIAIIMDLYQDIDNRITIRFKADGTLGFVVRVAGVNEVSVEPADVLANATWYFIMWAKIGTTWGLYLGAKDSGTIDQIGYGSFAAGNFLTSPTANFGRRGDAAQYVQDGRVGQGFIIRNNNAWSLAPVVGLTDSFTEPTVPFTDRFLRGY